MKWISIKNKLPEIGDRIIGYNEENSLITEMFYGNYTEKLIGGKVPLKITFYSYEDCCGRYEYEAVTHWMPFPDKPQELELPGPNSNSFRCRYCGHPEKSE